MTVSQSPLLFPDLGVGVGLRGPHLPQFLVAKPASVNWVEVISENYMRWPGQSPAATGAGLAKLQRVRAQCSVALHGVSLSLGSAEGIDRDYLKRLKELVDLIDPAVVSDHLCWSREGGRNLHDLLPLPFTEEAIQTVVAAVDEVQNFLGRRILIENLSSYVQWPQSQMSEWEFLTEILSRADCGLLLDVNNIFVSSVNHGFSAEHYLAALPAARIGQIHVAGHSRQGARLIDTHDAAVAEPVWELLAEALTRLGPRSLLLERDDRIPPWTELEIEIYRLQEIYDGYPRHRSASL